MFTGHHLTKNPAQEVRSPDLRHRRLPQRLEPLLQSPSTNNSPSITPLPNQKRRKGRFHSVGVTHFTTGSEDEDDDSTIASNASSNRHDARAVIANMEMIHHRDDGHSPVRSGQRNSNHHRPEPSPLARTLKMIDEYETELTDHERHYRLRMARSSAQAILASTTLGSVASDLQRSFAREENNFDSLALYIEVSHIEWLFPLCLLYLLSFLFMVYTTFCTDSIRGN